MDNLADCSVEWFGVPRQYAFLLLGWLAGLAIGFLLGRSRGDSTDAAPPAAVPASAAVAPQGVNLVVNGRVVDVPSAAMAEIQELLRAENKIEAIKCMRAATGMGLAEAKAVVDSLGKIVH
jgi:hypothetical protein